MSAMIAVRELRRIYQMGEFEVQALRGVSFEMSRGEFVAIMGPSGSGKSTLMNLIGCLDTPTAGQYTLDGLPVDELDPALLAAVRNRKIGFVFQQFHLLARATALQNVALPLAYRGGLSAAERLERAAAALERVGLGERMDHRPRQSDHGALGCCEQWGCAWRRRRQPYPEPRRRRGPGRPRPCPECRRSLARVWQLRPVGRREQ